VFRTFMNVQRRENLERVCPREINKDQPVERKFFSGSRRAHAQIKSVTGKKSGNPQSGGYN